MKGLQMTRYLLGPPAKTFYFPQLLNLASPIEPSENSLVPHQAVSRDRRRRTRKSRPDPLTSIRPACFNFFTLFTIFFMKWAIQVSTTKASLLSTRIFRCRATGTNNFNYWKHRESPQFILGWKHPKFHQRIATDEHCKKNTMYDMNVFQTLLSEVGEEREVLSPSLTNYSPIST